MRRFGRSYCALWLSDKPGEGAVLCYFLSGIGGNTARMIFVGFGRPNCAIDQFRMSICWKRERYLIENGSASLLTQRKIKTGALLPYGGGHAAMNRKWTTKRLLLCLCWVLLPSFAKWFGILQESRLSRLNNLKLAWKRLWYWPFLFRRFVFILRVTTLSSRLASSISFLIVHEEGIWITHTFDQSLRVGCW